MRLGELPKVSEKGFTLMEAMIALLILAAMLLIAVPSFNAIRLSANLTALANEVVSSVQFARSEAIKNNGVVRMCVSDDGNSCAVTGGFSDGWLVQDSQNRRLMYFSAASGKGYKVSASGGIRTLVFYPSGLGATTATFTICRQDPLGREQRQVVVGPTGGTRVTRTEASSC